MDGSASLMSSFDAPILAIWLHSTLILSTTSASSTALIASRRWLMVVLRVRPHRAWLAMSTQSDRHPARCCSHQGCNAMLNRGVEPYCLFGTASRLSTRQQIAFRVPATPPVQTATRVDPIAFAPAVAQPLLRHE